MFRCRRTVVVDGSSPFFRDRRIMDARFTCTTILPNGRAAHGAPTVYTASADLVRRESDRLGDLVVRRAECELPISTMPAAIRACGQGPPTTIAE